MHEILTKRKFYILLREIYSIMLTPLFITFLLAVSPLMGTEELKLNENNIDAIVKELTVEEKCELIVGAFTFLYAFGLNISARPPTISSHFSSTVSSFTITGILSSLSLRFSLTCVALVVSRIVKSSGFSMIGVF